MNVTERGGLVILEQDGVSYTIERSLLDTHVVIPERIRLLPDEPRSHDGIVAARHIAHDSGEGLPIAAIDGEVGALLEGGKTYLTATRILYADGTQCFADSYPRELSLAV